MTKVSATAYVCLLVGFLPGAALAQTAKAAQVEIKKTETGFHLLRNGEPYFIRGAGGRANLEALRAAGGNSIRTWHAADMGPTLDRAQELGLTVTVGLWLGHERHGFDYSNPEDVARDTQHAREAVLAYKDHPAVLMWGIGNEMEADGDNPLIWKTVNDIAVMIKKLDPRHPTMTVVAGTGHGKVRQLIKHCPDIDVIGINAYGDLRHIPAELKEQGLDRPYVLTEFGPFGWWQVDKTEWGAELEPTSTEKADTYMASYEATVAGQPQYCLGAYAFLWGDKQEHTRTWFGMFLPSGERTAAVDVMTREWTGDWPTNRCPRLQEITVSRADDTSTTQPAVHIYPQGVLLSAAAKAEDPDGDQLEFRWELRSESTDRRSGGDREAAPPAHPEAIVNASDSTATLKTPETPGPYRVFVYVLDGHDNAATANIPILVR